MGNTNIAMIGVGNGSWLVRDINFVAAFDIARDKAGKTESSVKGKSR